MRRAWLWIGSAAAAMACGTVEKEEPEESGPCSVYCDHAQTCDDTLEREACEALCFCMAASVKEEIRDDFITCQADLPCMAIDPEQICGMTVGGYVTPSEAAIDYIGECDQRLNEVGPCEDPGPGTYDCQAAILLVDDLIPAVQQCLAEPDCATIGECSFGAFFQACMPDGPGP